MKLYHVSSIPDLKILEPRVSTHGKPYVYATENLEFAMLFGSKKSNGDFDGTYGINDGKPFFYEAYPGALKRRFSGEECYIYEVDSANFEKGKTSFSGEVVSEKPAKILNCKKVNDVYQYLLNEISAGKMIFKQYDDSDKEYVSMMEEYIRDRIIRFNVLQNKDSNIYKFCKEYFPKIVQEIEDTKNIEI